jgi:hypothetical protein
MEDFIWKEKEILCEYNNSGVKCKCGALDTDMVSLFDIVAVSFI